MSKLSPIADKDGNVVGYIFECVGCDESHQIITSGPGETWEFNGDLEHPTFSPSYLTWVDPNPNADSNYHNGKYFNGFRCHSFIRDGKIEYLADCTHKYAGQTVELPEVDR